jgi:hypothetical protein
MAKKREVMVAEKQQLGEVSFICLKGKATSLPWIVRLKVGIFKNLLNRR